MNDLELQDRLRLLRQSPPDTGFELRLHNALLREGNLISAASTPALRPQPRAGRWLWRVAFGSVLALSGSAAAMWVADYVERVPSERASAASNGPVTLPAAHASRAQKAGNTLQPEAPPPAPPVATEPASNPAAERALPADQGSNPGLGLLAPPAAGVSSRMQPASSRSKPPVAATETPKIQPETLDRVRIPDNLLAADEARNAGSAPQLRVRPRVEIGDIAQAVAIEGNAAAQQDEAQQRGAEQRDKKQQEARSRRDNSQRARAARARRENAERGQARAQEAKQKRLK